ncbi:hypothetical protein WJ97_11180 [Burkholderia ubonensis]|uniref:metallophosphoesterase n=1 Tax=Burkholderia ubonensis TaxID=101571 RepID=UPI00075F0EBB|nr:metallophosphoesterase [Burkholderia ubonensis]KVP96444.1 hypothetical protein WJ97_11180 [Burkholderia ubonensis]
MEKQPLPRILLHSDLHLESGPFTLPPAPEGPAVAVFAGDVCSGDGGPAALRALSNLPTVYVAGNHEFWGGDYFERLAQLETRAKEHGIHFLENRAVVIHGVRFLGATLWTNYGGGHEALMSYGLWHMRDHQAITANSWWSEPNKARFVKQFGEHALERFEGKFNPLLAMELHKKTRAWLKRELAKPFDGPTVVVTHHAPAFDSLRRAGIHEHALNRDAWVRRMNDDLNLTKVGSYASEILPDLHYELSQAGVLFWAHGHLHHAMHYGVHGIQVAANPRGRVHKPLTKESARGFGWFGVSLSDADIERSQQAHRENPEDGDGFGYEKARSFDLAEPGYRVIEAAHQQVLETLEERRAELKALRPLVRSKRAAVVDLAGHRADTVSAAILKAVREFAESMSAQLGHAHHSTRHLDWLLSDCKLAGFREFAALESTGDYESLLIWRRIEEERTPAERERFGFHPGRYSAKSHLAHVEEQATKLMKALRKVPKACEQLRRDHLRMHRYCASR